ncbi:MAG: radical SAM protein [Gammaproteobacteria bacterium]|nr:radical SAM protein [Gammaproteobacteria bacterium]
MTQESSKYAFKYIYGPVPSWRLGSSLGVDLLSQTEKICNFNCIYCQLGKTTNYEAIRKIYVPTKDIIEELKKLPPVSIDYITFSGRGEPTLAKNLGETIKAIKKIRKEPIAILTNAALMNDPKIRAELALTDFIAAKLDVCSQEQLEKINQPEAHIQFDDIVQGIRAFRKEYPNKKLALQMMFIEQNKDNLEQFVKLINQIEPDEVQINTPLRTSPIKPLSKKEILNIKAYFSEHISAPKKIDVISVYDEREKKEIHPISDQDTLKRRGKNPHARCYTSFDV